MYYNMFIVNNLHVTDRHILTVGQLLGSINRGSKADGSNTKQHDNGPWES